MTFPAAVIAYFTRSVVDSPIPGDKSPIPPPAEGGPCPPGHWTGRLQTVADTMRSLGRDTEGGVLSLGDGLQTLNARTGEIVKTAGEVASAMSGEEISSDIGELRGLLDGMQSYLARTGRETETSEEKLRRIIHRIGRSHECMEGFAKIVKKLRILGIATRIESSRLAKGEVDFGALADDVERLSVLVEAKLGEILSREQALDHLVRQTLSRVLLLETEQRQRTRRILDEVREGLSTLTGIHGRYACAANVIVDRYGEVSKNISEIVMSMQFHDIMRQQVEHVCEALEELSAGNTTVGGGDPEEGTGEGNRRRIRRTADVCELQAAHAENARATFVGAVETLIGNLRKMTGNMAGILREVRADEEDAGGSRQAVLSGIERQLLSIAASLKESAETRRKLAEATRSMAESVEGMGMLLERIEEIGSEIELISLNARIKAAHTGKEGAALGVLAESIQGLSLEARDRTAKVSDAFRVILSAAGELRADIASPDVGEAAESGVGGIVGDLEALLEALRRLGIGVESLLARMEGPARALSGDIAALIAGIEIHRTVDRVLREAASRLKEIEKEADALVPDRDGTDKAGNLGVHRARYTMRGERRVHEEILDTAAPEKTPATRDGIGENVELF